MSAQPYSSPAKRPLYRVDLDDALTASLPVGAPPPSTPALEGEPPPGARRNSPPAFRIDHALYEHETRAAWLADELLMPGSIFHGKVHIAADKAGKKPLRQKPGATHVTYATFTTVIGSMLQQSTYVEDVCLPDELIAEAVVEGPNSLSHQKVEQGGQLLAGLFRHYWRAVATAFSDAWDDPHEHLLWHPHGLTAFAKLGGYVVHDQVVTYDIRQHYFDEVLERVADNVSLEKSAHASISARQLSEHLAQLLATARHAPAARRQGLMAVPGSVSDINWGSAVPPISPSVASIPLGPEN